MNTMDSGGAKGIEMPPAEIVAAAERVGRYFAERNMKSWALGPCASRGGYEEAVDVCRSIDDHWASGNFSRLETLWSKLRAVLGRDGGNVGGRDENDRFKGWKVTGISILTDEEAANIAVCYDIGRDSVHAIANTGAKKAMLKSADNLSNTIIGSRRPLDAIRAVGNNVGPCAMSLKYPTTSSSSHRRQAEEVHRYAADWEKRLAAALAANHPANH